MAKTKSTKQAKTKRASASRKSNTQRTTKSATKPVEELQLSEEMIRARAYQNFLARAGQPGDALADWLQAEHDLRREHNLA